MQAIQKKSRLKARIGDLVIVRFDPGEKEIAQNKKWCEVVGLVTKCCTRYKPRTYEFVYWERKGHTTEVSSSDLPVSRLIRARPKGKWDGVLSTLSLDNVEPVE